jgi:hypothetical protein
VRLVGTTQGARADVLLTGQLSQLTAGSGHENALGNPTPLRSALELATESEPPCRVQYLVYCPNGSGGTTPVKPL